MTHSMITPALSLIITAALALNLGLPLSKPQVELASHSINLKTRTPGGGYMSDVMSDNILLTLSYLNGEQINSQEVDWASIRRDRQVEFILNPGETFAFHEDVLAKYEGKIVKTTNSRFAADQGFKHDGYLMGDGVCHLASLIYWSAKDASLETYAPSNHNFMSIPGIAKEHGVSIYFSPLEKQANANKNLYIVNNQENPVVFRIEKRGDTLLTSVIKN